jgi:hypothetical protein
MILILEVGAGTRVRTDEGMSEDLDGCAGRAAVIGGDCYWGRPRRRRCLRAGRVRLAVLGANSERWTEGRVVRVAVIWDVRPWKCDPVGDEDYRCSRLDMGVDSGGQDG